MATDNIPTGDPDFNTWVGPFITYVIANAATLGLTPADVAPLTPALASWNTAFPAHNTAQQAALSATTNKNLSRHILEILLRPLIQQFQASTKVTDAQRNTLKINVRSKSRTAPTAPATTPLASVDTSQRLRHILSYRDSATGSKKKPKGVSFCEVWAKVGGPPPTDIGQMAYMGSASASPQLEEFTGAQAGQMVYYWLRWVNTRKEFGPWSEPVSATVPG